MQGLRILEPRVLQGTDNQQVLGSPIDPIPPGGPGHFFGRCLSEEAECSFLLCTWPHLALACHRPQHPQYRADPSGHCGKQWYLEGVTHMTRDGAQGGGIFQAKWTHPQRWKREAPEPSGGNSDCRVQGYLQRGLH